MKKSLIYSYKTIEAFAIENEFEIKELGINEIGANFIVLTNDHDKVISFMLAGVGSHGHIYECIYTDL